MEEFVGIHIYVKEGVIIDGPLKSIFLGIEEEGIPFQVYKDKISGSDELGWEASKSSRVGVGIGIDKSYVTLYYEKLNLGEPLFKYETISDEQKIRSIGSNSARLVKGIPFIILKK